MDMGFDAINVTRLFDFEKKAKFLYKCAKWRHRIFRCPKIMEYKRVSRFLLEMKSMPLKLYQQSFPIGIIHLVL